jgi:SNF2 family DNA or RNA helicase
MPLYSYQEEGVEMLMKTPRMFLADDMGTGKSAQVITAADRLGLERILIVCPNTMKGIIRDKRAVGGWAEEISKWASKGSVSVIEGSLAKRKQLINVETTYTIINYEALNTNLVDPLLDRDFDLVIFDESTRIKNRKAKTTKSAMKLAKRAERVWMLSGTPIMNRVSELWAPLNMLFPTDKKYRSYWRFVGNHCEVYKGQFGWVIKDITNPRDPKIRSLKEDLNEFTLRRTKPEVLKDMPSKTIQQVWVELKSVQKHVYDEMQELMLTEYEGKIISAAVVIAKIIRLKQIAIAPEVMFPEMDVGTGLHGAKIDALFDILESLGGKQVVIFSQFRQIIERLAPMLEKAGYNVAQLTGKTENRSEVVNAFQNGDIEVLLITTQAGGVGLTLTAASTAIFLDKMWAPSMNIQAQDRLHRIGQCEPVNIIELLALDTVEEGIESLLKLKGRVFDNLFEDEDSLEARDEQIKHLSLTGNEILQELFKGY